MAKLEAKTQIKFQFPINMDVARSNIHLITILKFSKLGKVSIFLDFALFTYSQPGS